MARLLKNPFFSTNFFCFYIRKFIFLIIYFDFSVSKLYYQNLNLERDFFQKYKSILLFYMNSNFLLIHKIVIQVLKFFLKNIKNHFHFQ